MTCRCVLQHILNVLVLFLPVLKCSIEVVADIVKRELYMGKGDHVHIYPCYFRVFVQCFVLCSIKLVVYVLPFCTFPPLHVI